MIDYRYKEIRVFILIIVFRRWACKITNKNYTGGWQMPVMPAKEENEFQHD